VRIEYQRRDAVVNCQCLFESARSCGRAAAWPVAGVYELLALYAARRSWSGEFSTRLGEFVLDLGWCTVKGRFQPSNSLNYSRFNAVFSSNRTLIVDNFFQRGLGSPDEMTALQLQSY
jgi:hypothetical protein